MVRIKRKTCSVCAQIKPSRLKSLEDFLNCLELFKEILENDSFEYVSSNFELEHPKNHQGCWQDDILAYIIRCKACGRKYSCSCDTYHGRASLSIVK